MKQHRELKTDWIEVEELHSETFALDHHLVDFSFNRFGSGFLGGEERQSDHIASANR